MKTRERESGDEEGRRPPAKPGPDDPREKGQEERKPLRRPFDAIRENLEAVIVAVVLALIIRHFSVEAFEIPTGSMAPTLYGIHAWVKCPNCHTEFNIGLQTDQSTGDITVNHENVLVYWGACPKCKLPHHRAYHDDGEPKGMRPVMAGDTFVCPFDQAQWKGEEGDFSKGDVFTERTIGEISCPICWYEFKEIIPNDWFHRTGGHKILVNKFAYKLGKPERWDVIVFQFDRETNYIKRLIGKPGEAVEIKAGDLFIDGKIERKFTRPEIQDVLWTKIADMDISERGYQKTPAWKEVFPPGSGIPAGSFVWDAPARRWSVNAGPAGSRTAALRYQRPIVNYYNYNVIYRAKGGIQAIDQVGDKKVAFGARVPRGGKGWIGAEIRKGEFAFQLRIPVGKPDPANPATLRRLPPSDPERYQADRTALPPEGDRPWPSAEAALRPDAVTRVEFENADDRLAARIDGVEVLSLEYDSHAKVLRGPEENGLYLLAGDGAACDLESIRVYRDIFYTGDNNAHMNYAANGRPIVLASDGEEREYFACGDNSPASSDGRFWGSVPERNLMGEALLVFWPLWPANWQFKIIR